MSASPEKAAEVLARFRQQKKAAGRLAELVCLATRIEPGLLREARLLLAPGTDAGAEADLWFSPLVESWSARAFVLLPSIVALLQTELLKDRERAQRAWALLERLHSGVPPIVAVEERVTWLALSQGLDALPEIERELQAILRTMLHDEHQGPGVARWALRTLPRLPSLVRETNTARLLAFGAAARLGTRALTESTVSLPSKDASWLLPQLATAQRRGLRIERSTEGLTFLSGEEQGRGHYLLVPNTKPLLLEVLWSQDNQEQHRLVEPTPGRRLSISAEVTAIRLRTVTGDEYDLIAESPTEGAPPPAYLDQTIWQSCVWIPNRIAPTTGYFIDSSAFVTAAVAFSNDPPGTRVEIFWNGKPFTATLLETNFDSGYALLELPEGSPRAVPVPDEELLDTERPASDESSRQEWIAYAVLDREQHWIEGSFGTPPVSQLSESSEDETSTFQAIRGSGLFEQPQPLGMPLFLSGVFLAGHINGWIGGRVLPGGTVQAREALAKLRGARSFQRTRGNELPLAELAQEEDVPQQKKLEPVRNARLDELRRLIQEHRPGVETEIALQVPKRLEQQEIARERHPFKAHKATISRVDGPPQALLRLSDLGVESGNTALLKAEIEVDRVTVVLQTRPSDASESSADYEEAEAVVSLRLIARVEIGTETPEDAKTIISAVHVSGVESIRVEHVHSAPELRRAVKTPSASTDQSLFQQAVLLENLSNRLSELGRREESLKVTLETVDLHRTLAQRNPDAFLSDLAASLNHLGTSLTDLGRHEDALKATAEALEIRRALAQRNPDASLSDVVASLDHLGTKLATLGRLEEALKSISEAVAIYRSLVSRNPDASQPGLATSLTNLGNRLSALDHREEAMRATSEAVEIYRSLVQLSPESFQPGLAMSLTSLGNALSALGHREEALKATSEAVELYRLLAQRNPEAFQPNLAGNLSNLGNLLSELGRHEEALALMEEATDTLWPFLERLPHGFTRQARGMLASLRFIEESLGRPLPPVFQKRMEDLERLLKTK